MKKKGSKAGTSSTTGWRDHAGHDEGIETPTMEEQLALSIVLRGKVDTLGRRHGDDNDGDDDIESEEKEWCGEGAGGRELWEGEAVSLEMCTHTSPPHWRYRNHTYPSNAAFLVYEVQGTAVLLRQIGGFCTRMQSHTHRHTHTHRERDRERERWISFLFGGKECYECMHN